MTIELIKPEATRKMENGWIDVALKADELCKNYRPVWDLTKFCLWHELIMKWREFDDEPYINVFKIEVTLILSENEEVNQKSRETLNKLDIIFNEDNYENFLEWKDEFWPESEKAM